MAYYSLGERLSSSHLRRQWIALWVGFAGFLWCGFLIIPSAGADESSAPAPSHEARSPNALFMAFGGRSATPLGLSISYERDVFPGFILGGELGTFATEGPTNTVVGIHTGFRWPTESANALSGFLGGSYRCVKWVSYEDYNKLDEWPGCEDNFVLFGGFGYEYSRDFLFRFVVVPQIVVKGDTTSESIAWWRDWRWWWELDLGFRF